MRTIKPPKSIKAICDINGWSLDQYNQACRALGERKISAGWSQQRREYSMMKVNKPGIPGPTLAILWMGAMGFAETLARNPDDVAAMFEQKLNPTAVIA